MVEQPQNTYIVKEEKSKEASNDELAEDVIDSEVVVIRHKAITSKIRSTIKHLQDRAGFRARWRGLTLFVIYFLLHAMIRGFLLKVFVGSSLFAPTGVVALILAPAGAGAHIIAAKAGSSIIASVLLARLATTWVHIVISEPSSKSWFARVPERKIWKAVWGPTILADLAVRLTIVLPVLCFKLLSQAEATQPAIVASQFFICFAIALVSFVGLAVPAGVSLVRVQASMLPEDSETIVPFDRTFGGRVVPAILGGTGAIGYKDAWKTFDYAARFRIVKHFLKLIAIDIALHVFFGLVLGLQAAILFGPAKTHNIVFRGKM